ncbi:hypothetical protein LIQ52_11085 [Mitsuokella jalaludinii]|uniref:hypothetical protein n=1 Tax=Mitsuokella jalaludinii TaxID=187979 RepID=UPI001D02BF91|nr:hypothetical protein [Mitsuokella jalaludinii]MCB5725854.1 hypothetical protein [Mitsuokella jalaludinii]
MSTWTDMRDKALEAMKEGALDVVEETKQEFIDNFIEAGMPAIKAYAELFSATVQEQAKNETGWVKIRDMLVIPLAVKAVLGVGSGVLSMVRGKTSKATTA